MENSNNPFRNHFRNGQRDAEMPNISQQACPSQDQEPPPYSHAEPRVRYSTFEQDRIVRDLGLMNGILQQHSQRAHREGYRTMVLLLSLAGRYEAERYIQKMCQMCYLIHQVKIQIHRQMTQNYYGYR